MVSNLDAHVCLRAGVTHRWGSGRDCDSQKWRKTIRGVLQKIGCFGALVHRRNSNRWTSQGLRVCAILMGMLMGPLASPALASDFVRYQSEEPQALLERLDDSPAEDHGRIYILLARQSLDKNIEQAEAYLELARTHLPSNDPVGQAYLNVVWCYRHVLRGTRQDADQTCRQVLEQAHKTQDVWVISKAYSALSIMFYQRGQLDEAMTHAVEASNFAQRSEDRMAQANQHNILGLILRAQGLYRDALDKFTLGLRSLDLGKPADREMYFILSFNLGMTHADMGDYEMARDYYSAVLNWAEESGSQARIPTVRLFTGIANNELGHPRKTVEDISSLIEREGPLPNPGDLGFAYAVLGDAYHALGQNGEALTAYEKGRAIAAQQPTTLEQRRLDIGYARALMSAGKLRQSEAVLEQAIQRARDEKTFEYLRNGVLLMAQNLERQQRFAESLVVYKEAEQLGRQFQQQVIERNLALLRAEFEITEKQEALDAARQATLLRNGFILLLLLVGFVSWLYFTKRMEQHKAEKSSQHVAKLKEQIVSQSEALEGQLNRTKTVELGRMALERRLLDSEPQRVLGLLTGGVAHDFNNLLTVISGATELLELDDKGGKTRESLYDNILLATSSGADISRALMAQARSSDVQLQAVNLNSFIADRVSLLSRSLGSMVDLKFSDWATSELDVVVDPGQLTTALMNLVLNARDAQNQKGQIRIGLQSRDEHWAVISVADDGHGMSDEQIQRATEPFYTTKPNHGTGLGLSMVNRFATQLGGQIEIISEPDKGCLVSIILPVANSAALSAVDEENPGAPGFVGRPDSPLGAT